MIPGKTAYASSGLTAVAQSGNTELCRVDVSGMEHVLVEVTVAGQALDAFTISAKGHESGAGATLASAAGDYTTPNAPIIKASGDLTTQAVGSGWALVDVRGWRELIVSASSGNPAGSSVTAYVTGA